VTYLYVIAADNAAKVGISNHPERRLQFLQLETSQILRLVDKFKFGCTSQAREIEGKCHRALEAHRLAGSEWFSCDPQECVDLARNLHSSAISDDEHVDDNAGSVEVATDLHRAFTAVLRVSRKEAKLTQRELADRLGKPRSYVSKIESGERIPRITEFCEIAQALKLDPQLLFQRFWQWR
jgi:DNA-binding XRE family transcriptional regulator